jgi:hypothetical protein
MKTRLTITAAATTAALAGTLALSPAASAAVTPVIDANATGWSHMTRQPAAIYIGNGGSPGVVHLSWQHWDGTWAGGTGKLIIMHNPHCTPTYQCRYDTYNVKVWLHRVITHRGVPVYSRMRWTYGRARHVLWLRLTRTGFWTY